MSTNSHFIFNTFSPSNPSSSIQHTNNSFFLFRGEYFAEPSALKELIDLKLDGVLQCLRHFNRMKEIWGPAKLNQFFVCKNWSLEMRVWPDLIFNRSGLARRRRSKIGPDFGSDLSADRTRMLRRLIPVNPTLNPTAWNRPAPGSRTLKVLS